MKYVDEYRSPGTVRGLVEEINRIPGEFRFMEVCGTHTTAISRAGLRAALGPAVTLVSGPGCPVCVTPDSDVDRAIALARMPGVTLATFGDMVKVPGTVESLAGAAAGGASVKVVYSPLDALALARDNPSEDVVFLAVGFETTAPAVAATVLEAREEDVPNFFVLCLHKLVPPALRALLSLEEFEVDGFLLPGHVSAVIGGDAYGFIADEFGVPGVVAGFEPADILQAVHRLMLMRERGAAVEIEYSRVVRGRGNRKAVSVMERVFEPVSSEWRGLFTIPESGLALRREFRDRDAGTWPVEIPEPGGDRGCRCGEIITGSIRPDECPNYGTGCTPDDPLGPCMVSSEGTCAAYYLYSGEP